MKFARCSEALYYDLVKIPHGHIPAPKVKFWSWLPLPVKGYRTWKTFYCPVCHQPSFFKIWSACQDCQIMSNWTYDSGIYKRKTRREKRRNRWKQIEYAFLPLLALFGKATYLRSIRIHARDQPRYGGNLTDKLREEIYDERVRIAKKTGVYHS